MKTNYFIFILLLSVNLQAQFWSGFEDCPGDGIPYPNGGGWTYWGCGGGSGCSITCTTAQVHSGDYAGLIPDDETSTAILDLGSKIFGQWGLEFWMYIPSGKEAYWNLQGVIPIGSGEWIVGNVFFNQDIANSGVGLIDDTALGEIYFNFPHDQWFRVVMNFDISTGIGAATWQFNVDGIDVVPFGTPFTNFAGTAPTSLGGMSFFSISNNNILYLDDFNFVNGFIDPEPLPIPLNFNENMEYSSNDSFGDWWYTPITITEDQAQNGIRSGVISSETYPSTTLDLGSIILGDFRLDQWMYIPSGKEAAFSILGSMPGWEDHFCNVYFNKDNASPGVGIIENTYLGYVAFPFPHDQWFKVIMDWDLTLGNEAATWVFWVSDTFVIDYGTPFSTFEGVYPTSIGGIRYYANNETSLFYFDSINFNDFGILESESFNKNQFVIFPNPSSETITVSTTETINKIFIYNLIGNKVLETTTPEAINISGLSSGIYFIRVETDNGNGVQKLIKE